MEISKQTQNAGDNSFQIQSTGSIFILNTQEKFFPFLSKEQNEQIHEEHPQKAIDIINTIREELNHLDSRDRINLSIFRHAAETVHEIDKSALCALTIFYILSYLSPNSLTIHDGLTHLSAIMEKLSEEGLPTNSHWIDHLELLKTIRFVSPWAPRKLSQYYPECVPGYTSLGIKIGSPQHEQAKKILQDAQLPDTFLINNEFLSDYVRFPLPDSYMISSLAYHSVPLTEKQKQALQQVIRLYDTDPNKKEIVNKRFMMVFDTFPVLKKIHTWWDTIPYSFDATPVGLLLATLNAQRFESNIPDYFEE